MRDSLTGPNRVQLSDEQDLLWGSCTDHVPPATMASFRHTALHARSSLDPALAELKNGDGTSQQIGMVFGHTWGRKTA